MQRKALRPEGDKVDCIETGEIAQLFCVARIGEDIVGTKHRRERPELARQRRANPRIPRSIGGFGEIECGAQRSTDASSVPYAFDRPTRRDDLLGRLPPGRVTGWVLKCVIFSIRDAPSFNKNSLNAVATGGSRLWRR